MNKHDESDNPIVPGKQANKTPFDPTGQKGAAERAEGRGLAKGNSQERNTDRTQSRARVKSAHERIRKVAKEKRGQKFTALLHHVYDVAQLHEAYYGIHRNASAGTDGADWKEYGQNLEENLQELSDRIRRGAYRAKATRRVMIPKRDGSKRPIGVMTLEDKIVQRSMSEVLQCIYEVDFRGFSYGFRPGRNAHQALDAVSVGIRKRKVSWVLDADIRGFFDTLDHEWLVKFLKHRIADKRVIRLIQKWLKAGVIEEGRRKPSKMGAVQGGSISPLLANIYLHYALDLWTESWRNRVKGDVIIVRYADDFVVGFQYRQDAERYLSEVTTRLESFGLELHAKKTRIIEFGRFAKASRDKREDGKPETFDFLGFTHCCGQDKAGWFSVLRKSKRKNVRNKLKEVQSELRKRMHSPVPEQGKYLVCDPEKLSL